MERSSAAGRFGDFQGEDRAARFRRLCHDAIYPTAGTESNELFFCRNRQHVAASSVITVQFQ
jgi:hypothetical protein